MNKTIFESALYGAALLFVSPSGNDRWSGRIPVPNGQRTDGPLATLNRARDVLRSLRAAGQTTPREPLIIEVAEGEYCLDAPLALDARDSGTSEAPVIWRAARGVEVKLSGGIRITDWQPVSDPSTLTRLPPASRGKVMVADLPAHGVRDFGVMESSQGWAQSDPGLELFYRDKPMTLARYPNEGFLRIASLSAEGEFIFRGIHGNRMGKFYLKDETERLRRWAEEPNPMLHGYWFYDWADQRIAIKSINADTGEITLDDRYPHAYGYRTGQWFYGFNMLCELDAPGEWYLDRQRGLLYFWPPEPLSSGDAVVSVRRDPVRLQDVSWLALQGFTIEACRGTGITIEGGEGVSIIGCTIRNVGADAVRIMGGKKHCVSECDIYQTGDGGVQIDGGDRKKLVPGGHEAVNNHVHHIARWNPLYHVRIQLRGVGNRAAHNRLHDLPHVAIGFTGNDQIVEYNEIYRVCTQANDAGAIYTSGEHPEDWSMRGHRIRFNYLHHCFGFQRHGCSGVYLDDMFSGTEIQGNVFYKMHMALLLGGGRDIRVLNNVFVDCNVAIHLDARALGWAAPYVPEVIEAMEKMPYKSEPWASRYPELVGILDDEPARPKGNIFERNLICNCAVPWDIAEVARPGSRQSNNIEEEDPGFFDRQRLDFRLRPNSPALKMGFKEIPIDRIGLQPSSFRPTVPSRRCFDAVLRLERPPRLRQGHLQQAGLMVLRICNVGDAVDSSLFRLRMHGATLKNPSPLSCRLKPFAVAEKKYKIMSNAREFGVEVLGDELGDIEDETDTEQSMSSWLSPPYPIPFQSTEECLSSWPPGFFVSDPMTGKVESVSAPTGKGKLSWRKVAVQKDSHFCDVHTMPGVADPVEQVIFFAVRVRCAEPVRIAALLGYDGPAKLFVDGAAVFYDPAGTNPARRDMAAPEFDVGAGEHDLVVALGTNVGKAWGIFLRLLRVDPGGAQKKAPVPEWITQ